MLFRKDIEPCCVYCAHGVSMSSTEVACIKCGVVSSGGYCKKFSYDPLKRVPARVTVPNSSAFSEDDFKL